MQLWHDTTITPQFNPIEMEYYTFISSSLPTLVEKIILDLFFEKIDFLNLKKKEEITLKLFIGGAVEAVRRIRLHKPSEKFDRQ